MKQLSLFEPITFEITGGHIAMIDPVDGDLLRWTWSGKERTNGYIIVVRKMSRGKSAHLGRVIIQRIMGKRIGHKLVVDHINHNPLDNRRVNLRTATISQNNHNRSNVRGTYKPKFSKSWGACISIEKKHVHLGMFPTEEEAHQAYRAASLEYYGEFSPFYEHGIGDPLNGIAPDAS